MRRRVGLLDALGLKPLRPSLEQCWDAIAGDGYAPPSQWGPSSLKILKPWWSVPLWLGWRPTDDRVLVYNLFNRCVAPREEGYSVRVSQVEDFRGGRLTYDGHVGTDFATPPGTDIVTAAPGIVRQVRTDMQRGGLKMVVDHGEGWITTYSHLARTRVGPGHVVRRGEVLASSGMSGVDGVLFSPWLAPHLHFNVLLDGQPVDPYPTPGETSLWRSGTPRPHRPGDADEPLTPTAWAMGAVDDQIERCRDPELRAELAAIGPADERAVAVVIARLFYRHRFPLEPVQLTATRHPRRPVLDLPFSHEDYRGCVIADEVAISELSPRFFTTQGVNASW